MIITQKAIPRRTVLRGLGASLALPLLDGMVPALLLTKHSGRPVRRFGVVYVPNGMMMNHWTPSTEGSGFEFPLVMKP
ncbi:MAG: hypothetical protein Ct9H300mP25_09770 [Acidobacteriota bacterium]|nr:MAG: hypothetical protein Ct9H300mP25_09770 [Acidobacteriota bacterium]